MFERLTDEAREVMAMAHQEAQGFNHEYLGTEHVLLGLVKQGAGAGATVLKHHDIDLHKVRMEVEKLVKRGPNMVPTGKLPLTPRAKKVIKYAIEEARSLNHNYVGTEHLLLGLLREEDGIAAEVLMNLGQKLEDVRAEVLNEDVARDENLTTREREVLALITEGYSTAEIAKRLYLSPKTIQSYRQSLGRKHGCSRTPTLDGFCRFLTNLVADMSTTPEEMRSP